MAYFLPAIDAEVNAYTTFETTLIQLTHQFGVNFTTKISSFCTKTTTPGFLEDANSSLEYHDEL